MSLTLSQNPRRIPLTVRTSCWAPAVWAAMGVLGAAAVETTRSAAAAADTYAATATYAADTAGLWAGHCSEPDDPDSNPAALGVQNQTHLTAKPLQSNTVRGHGGKETRQSAVMGMVNI